MTRIKAVLILFSISTILAFSISKDVHINTEATNLKRDSTAVQKYYARNKGNNQPSMSIGTTGNGTLENAKLIPFSGKNFEYFDSGSYLMGRAYTNDKVLRTVLATYQDLDSVMPNRKFYIMEASKQFGGKLWPHRTHQNGLSIDFMMPMLKDNKPYYGFTKLGVQHYQLHFNDNGTSEDDESIKIDFNTIARHILLLNRQAKKQRMKVSKVIIKIEYKPYLFATEYGKLLKKSGIYVVQSLTPAVNQLHDEHFHIDFSPL
jgi:penicillin-insensitive murein endopeptidase